MTIKTMVEKRHSHTCDEMSGKVSSGEHILLDTVDGSADHDGWHIGNQQNFSYCPWCRDKLPTVEELEAGG